MKRIIDILVAAAGILLLLPLMAAIAVIIRIESPGPVFYRAERVGLHGRRLRMLKFRKMWVGVAGPLLTTSGDPRLTRFGAILARTRLDEVPQLWHVLRGDMSLVGPRPEDPEFVARFAADYADVLRVRPGITGWTQVAFADEAKILHRDDPLGHYLADILPQKIALDRLYAARCNARCDAGILTATVRTVVLRHSIAVDRETGRLTRRRRPAAEMSHAPVRGLEIAVNLETPAATGAIQAAAAQVVTDLQPEVVET